jgi:hypothetical protein
LRVEEGEGSGAEPLSRELVAPDMLVHGGGMQSEIELEAARLLSRVGQHRQQLAVVDGLELLGLLLLLLLGLGPEVETRT